MCHQQVRNIRIDALAFVKEDTRVWIYRLQRETGEYFSGKLTSSIPFVEVRCFFEGDILITAVKINHVGGWEVLLSESSYDIRILMMFIASCRLLFQNYRTITTPVSAIMKQSLIFLILACVVVVSANRRLERVRATAKYRHFEGTCR